MKNEKKGLKKPFFANFLENQVSGEQKENVQGGAADTTQKYPSDQEDDFGGPVTQKYPSDNDEEGQTS